MALLVCQLSVYCIVKNRISYIDDSEFMLNQTSIRGGGNATFLAYDDNITLEYYGDDWIKLVFVPDFETALFMVLNLAGEYVRICTTVHIIDIDGNSLKTY